MKRLFVLATLMVAVTLPPAFASGCGLAHTTKIESPAQSTGV